MRSLVPALVRAHVLVCIFSLTSGCASRTDAPLPPAPPLPPAAQEPPRAPAVISIIGTNDLHGALERLPILAGYVNNLRAARARDGGVVLLDAGDMFQGTLESNLNEGAAVIEAYGAMGYAAVTIGNHEFDFGPAGPATTPKSPGDDPRGALKQRLAEARFPLLAANILDAATGARVDWPNAPASVMHTVAGVQIGIVGVTTERTPETTVPANFVGLAMAKATDAIAGEARDLRARGADLVIVAAHIGGACQDLHAHEDISSCREDEEIMDVARALPTGLVDVIVAGHTHQAMAHHVNGIAIIESYAKGRAFGRVDITVVPGGARREVREVRIHAPAELCPSPQPGKSRASACSPGMYEGAQVTPDPAIARIVERAMASADALRKEPLGITVTAPITGHYARESPLGNLVSDLMREVMPADVAVTNGGGLRADLPAGPLTYGSLYEVLPFDNGFATIRVRAADLAAAIAKNLGDEHGIALISGAIAEASCAGNTLQVRLRRPGGALIADSTMLTVTTSDFLATGGSNLFLAQSLAQGAVTIHSGDTIRDALASFLRRRGGTLTADSRVFQADKPRLRYPGTRPVTCPQATARPGKETQP